MNGAVWAGLDVGGTKCAVSIAHISADGIDVLDKRKFPTPTTPQAALARFEQELREILGDRPLQAIGISCGSPLDSRKGLVLSPPNLPGWDAVPITAYFQDAFGVPTRLQNDANACALAEWRFGAGRGFESLLFLTFGTGMGAGLILDGRLYSGCTDNAGEVGHISLERFGPIGYGKYGSFEGFCSGGGIARLASMRALEAIHRGEAPAICPTPEAAEKLSAFTLAAAAQQGDAFSLELFREVGEYLGRGLALLIDILNPEAIVIGSIYARQQALLEPSMRRVLERECLPVSLRACRILPAQLGESVGDYAALCVAGLE